MRYNNRKSTTVVPASLSNTTTLAEANRIAQTMDKTSIDSDIYRGGANKDVVNSLKALYGNKCAYCENTEYDPEVEHYRPKKRVIRETGHNGYYWLCYEWTNLLPSCHDCNTIGGGKADQFPIRGTRQTAPPFDAAGNLDRTRCLAHLPPLTHENALLLHPEIDQPEDFFRFDWEGAMIGTDGNNGRGNNTIDICNLNRQNLKAARKEMLDEIKKGIEYSFFLYINNRLNGEEALKQCILDIFASLEHKAAEINQTPFSLVAWYAFNNFEQFVIPKLLEGLRGIVTNVFQSYLRGRGA